MQRRSLATDTPENQRTEAFTAITKTVASTGNTMKSKASKLLTNQLSKQLRRAQVLKGMSETMVGGYRAITKVDGWGEVPKRDELPRYNRIFCRNVAAAFHIEVVAVEPIPETHGLWAGNHVSWMDIPVMGSVVPAFFLSKAEVEKMPAFGRLARACGSLFIKRGSGDSGKVAGQITEFLEKGHSVLFYPEGTTTDGTHIKKIYGKLLQAAMDADKPIQPLVVCYVNDQGELDDQVPFVGDTSFTKSFLNVMDSGPVTAYILPLEKIETTGKTRDELTELLHQSMQQGLEDLHSRVLKKATDSTASNSDTDNTADKARSVA